MNIIFILLGTGYQVLRTDTQVEEDITKSMTLPVSNNQHIIGNEHDTVSFTFLLF